MENTGGDTSWINGNNKRHNRSIHGMVISLPLDSNRHEKQLCYPSETSSEFHRCIIHSALDNISPHFSPYGKNTSIH